MHISHLKRGEVNLDIFTMTVQWDMLAEVTPDILSFLMSVALPRYLLTGPYDRHREDMRRSYSDIARAAVKEWFPAYRYELMGSILDGLQIPEIINSHFMTTKSVWTDLDYFYSDCDIWIFDPKLTVGYGSVNTFQIEERAYPSRYVKLVACCVRQPLLDRKELFVNSEGTTYLSGSAFINSQFGVISVSGANQIKSIHGPAVTVINTAVNSSDDFVFVLRCFEWPNVAKDWITRPRYAGWPSETQISELIKEGCDFVPMGERGSSFEHIEWRLSFSKVEQRLCRGFTTVQRQCILLAKTVLKLEFRNYSSYSTYLIKNAMFWIMEQVPEGQWATGSALGSGFLLLLHQVIHFLVQGHFPHYFIQQENLIKNTNRTFITDLLKVLVNIRKRPTHYIIKHSCLSPLSSYTPQSPGSIMEDLCMPLEDCGSWYKSDSEVLARKSIVLKFMLLFNISRVEVDNFFGGAREYEEMCGLRITDPLCRLTASAFNLFLAMTTATVVDTSSSDEMFCYYRGCGILHVYLYCKTGYPDHSTAAKECFDKALALNPMHTHVMLFQAMLLLREGDLEGALHQIQIVVAVSKVSPPVYIRYDPELIVVLDNLLQQEFHTFGLDTTVYNIAWYLRVQILVLLGRHDEAEDAMEGFVVNTPKPLVSDMDWTKFTDNPVILVGYAFVWISDFSQAYNMFEMEPEHSRHCHRIRDLCAALSRYPCFRTSMSTELERY